jgi:serine/threonine protein kinase
MPPPNSSEPDPQSLAEDIFARFLTAREQGQSPDFEALLRQHPELATRLRQLDAQYVHWKSIFAQLAAPPATTSVPLAARLESRYGDDVDPGISLDPEPADADSGPSSELLKRLHAHAPKHARYKLQGEIGRGGMGAVIRVWDADLRRTLAMKVVLGKEDRTANGATPPIDSKTLGRFLEEAQITGQLDHPGIVPVHELGLGADGQVYFTMRLVKGEDLRTIFRHVETGHEGWNTARALSVMLKVCEAMAYAHSKGVIHRDLKPANIMVGKYGEVYVMDWGLARVAGKQDLHDLRMQEPQAGPSSQSVRTERCEERDGTPDSPLITLDGTVMGTPAYMSPEQAMGRVKELGPATDVYAIGAMLYHLLAVSELEMPYVPKGARMSARSVHLAVIQGAPKPLKELAPRAPAELVAIAEKALSRDIAQRYSGMDALSNDIRAYLEGRVVKAYRTGLTAEFIKWSQRQPLAFASTLIAAAVILGTNFFVLWVKVGDSQPFSPFAYLCLVPCVLLSSGICVLLERLFAPAALNPMRSTSATAAVFVTGALIATVSGLLFPQFGPWLPVSLCVLLHPPLVARILQASLGRATAIYASTFSATLILALVILAWFGKWPLISRYLYHIFGIDLGHQH